MIIFNTKTGHFQDILLKVWAEFGSHSVQKYELRDIFDTYISTSRFRRSAYLNSNARFAFPYLRIIN